MFSLALFIDKILIFRERERAACQQPDLVFFTTRKTDEEAARHTTVEGFLGERERERDKEKKQTKKAKQSKDGAFVA